MDHSLAARHSRASQRTNTSHTHCTTHSITQHGRTPTLLHHHHHHRAPPTTSADGRPHTATSAPPARPNLPTDTRLHVILAHVGGLRHYAMAACQPEGRGRGPTRGRRDPHATRAAAANAAGAAATRRLPRSPPRPRPPLPPPACMSRHRRHTNGQAAAAAAADGAAAATDGHWLHLLRQRLRPVKTSHNQPQPIRRRGPCVPRCIRKCRNLCTN